MRLVYLHAALADAEPEPRSGVDAGRERSMMAAALGFGLPTQPERALVGRARRPGEQEQYGQQSQHRSHFSTRLLQLHQDGKTLMEQPRIKVGLWVQAALRMGDIDGRPGMVVRRGDPDAGGILLVLRRRNEVSVLSQVRTSAESAWMRATGPDAVDEATADAYVARQVNRDPDLWVVEFTAPDLLPPFEAKLIE
ncbi:MAG: DUF1491 family protein [Janthinobacterium lividum]